MFLSGYIVTGGQDSVINIWAIGPSREEPLYTLLGHSDNVCALHVGGSGTIISGSWDKWVPLPSVHSRSTHPTHSSRRTAKVWANFQLVNDLVGHTQPVWAVVALQGDEYLTGAPLQGLTCHVPVRYPLPSGSADKTIKLWRQHKCLRTYHGHKDAVRTLALLTDVGFASGSNDRSVYDCWLMLCSHLPHSVKSQYGHLRGT